MEHTDTPTGHFTEYPCEDGDTILVWVPATVAA